MGFTGTPAHAARGVGGQDPQVQVHQPQLLGFDLEMLENPALPCAGRFAGPRCCGGGLLSHHLPTASPEARGRLGGLGCHRVPGEIRLLLGLPHVPEPSTLLPLRQRSHWAAAGKQNRLCQVLLWEIKQEAGFQRGWRLWALLLPVLTLVVGRDVAEADVRGEVVVGNRQWEFLQALDAIKARSELFVMVIMLFQFILAHNHVGGRFPLVVITLVLNGTTFSQAGFAPLFLSLCFGGTNPFLPTRCAV